MKKAIFVLAAMAVISACSSNSSAGSSEDIKQLKDQISQLTTENQKLRDELAKNTPPAQTEKEKGPANADSDKKSNEGTENVLALNKATAIPDFAEMTVKKASFTAKVVPPKPDSFYTYYEVKDKENIYLDTVISIKSLLAESKSADEFASVKVKYDGKYEYDSFSTIEEQGGGNFTFTNISSIEPLKTRVLHFIAELPKEAAKDEKPVVITVTIEGKDYLYKLRG
ncbi:hypothetical protein [Cohnella sp. REN36]|uniref:hypothetical protein n=1 Tax=Cohnella sp. REN36 TaxID=2887347 RepID=UPI001D147B1B|nr:hypothetical protein [Cohnella sp. REN36]MCC3373817.1 hypothetical protein [Cohnella sp. REN36]